MIRLLLCCPHDSGAEGFPEAIIGHGVVVIGCITVDGLVSRRVWIGDVSFFFELFECCF